MSVVVDALIRRAVGAGPQPRMNPAWTDTATKDTGQIGRTLNVQRPLADERESLPETQGADGQTAPGCPGLGPTGGGTCRTAARGQ